MENLWTLTILNVCNKDKFNMYKTLVFQTKLTAYACQLEEKKLLFINVFVNIMPINQ